MKISYAICANNESVELDTLLSVLNFYKAPDDDIVVLLDTKATPEVKHICDKYKRDIKCYTHDLGKNFAAHKNYLFNKCKGDYIFNIDADEVPNSSLLKYLHDMLRSNADIEVYYIPRINLVTGITPEHIRKWNWRTDANGHINFPDYQLRICKNITDIKWEGKVHERLVGFTKYASLPTDDEWCLLHVKTIEKQESQNKFYETI